MRIAANSAVQGNHTANSSSTVVLCNCSNPSGANSNKTNSNRFNSNGFIHRLKSRLVYALIACTYLVALIVIGLHTQLGQIIDTTAMIAVSQFEFTFLQAVSQSASLSLLAVLAAIVAAVAMLRRRFSLAVRAVLIVVAANATCQILKLLLERPYLGVGYDLDNSFPSGHATFSASLGIAFIVVAPAGFRTIAAVFSWLWIMVMGFSVIQQGWHRPADVLGAICICVFWGLLLAPQENQVRQFPGLRRFLFSAAAWIFVSSLVILLIVLAFNTVELLSMHNQVELVAFAQIVVGKLIGLSALLLILGTSGLGCAVIDLLCFPARKRSTRAR